MNTKESRGLINPLNVGSKVIHKFSSQIMTIERISETVAKCRLESPEPYKIMGIEYPGDVAICSIENLIPL